MLGNRKLLLDTFCEVYDLIKHWADDYFWDLTKHTAIPNSIYLIGREQVRKNPSIVRELTKHSIVIFSNPHEGSETLIKHCMQYGVHDLVQSGQLLVISGGDLSAEYQYLQYDSFLPKILDYKENLLAIDRYDHLQIDRPYKFLFLNGRYRLHRKHLLDTLDLDQTLWTNLDQQSGSVHYLPTEYEVDRYQHNLYKDNGFVKYNLFNNEWGEIYLNHLAYQDTYFSLVTETVFDYPYSFRTEKIWKPIAIGHPFIVVANMGYYRDLHNLGFKTFGHLIDESFDLIDHNQTRLNCIIEIIKDLCQQDLASFLKECYTVCKYNQQHLAELQITLRKEFPNRFLQFVQHHRHE